MSGRSKKRPAPPPPVDEDVGLASSVSTNDPLAAALDRVPSSSADTERDGVHELAEEEEKQDQEDEGGSDLVDMFARNARRFGR